MADFVVTVVSVFLTITAILHCLEAVELKKIDVGDSKVFSDADIAQFDGRDPDKPLYMAIKGVVFDVTAGKDFYAKGASYNVLTGKDSTRAVAKMSLDPHDLNRDISDLTTEQLEFLDKIFEGTYKSKYPIVGYMDYIVKENLRSQDKTDL